MNSRAHLFIIGKVQGVYFRQNTKRYAQKRGVYGWIRNLDDGQVEVVFEGEESAVKELVDFCSKGPEGSLVTNVTINWVPFKGEFQSFDIVY